MNKRYLPWLLMQAAIATGITGLARAADEATQRMPEVQITAPRSVTEKNQLPVTTESVTAEKVVDTVNAMTVDDAIKYMPGVTVRRRFVGDTQAPMTTRTSGYNASARSLIYADGFLLSALIGNNNSNASPRWGLVSPSEIERVDLLYGPFSAAYPGNSMGSVLEITTRMPQHFEADANVTTAWHNFDIYNTHDTYRTTQGAMSIGARTGDLSYFFMANYLDSQSQPITIVTAQPSGTGGVPVTGAIADYNRLNQPIQVLGAGTINETKQETFKAKFAYDFSSTIRAIYTLGYWRNDSDAHVQSYLRDADGKPVYSGPVNIGGQQYSTAFASGINAIDQEHWMHGLSVRSDTRGAWDWEAVASMYDFATDSQRSPLAVDASGNGTGRGRITSFEGTGWYTLDLKGKWRPYGTNGLHELSFGAHYDRYNLDNPTYNTDDWLNGGPSRGGLDDRLFSNSQGKTETQALWLQDVWRFAPMLKATLGGRYEWWDAFEGFNRLGGQDFQQPDLDEAKFSPKASLQWETPWEWLVTASVGKAYRFPTVTELYSAATVNGITFTPNPFLKPENALSTELAFERFWDDGKLRVSLFQEDLKDALISQLGPAPNNGTSNQTQNIDKVRSRGVEVVLQQNDVFIKGLELAGSVTYVDTEILEDPSFPDAEGKQTPNIPTWRGTVVATYRPDDKWTATLAARYSTRTFSTVDNIDTHGGTYQGFEGFFVVDTRLRYEFTKQWSAAVGVDNLNNQVYWLFHPFPQRTYFAELRYNY